MIQNVDHANRMKVFNIIYFDYTFIRVIRVIMDSFINILSNSYSVMMNLKDEPSQFPMYDCIVVGCKIRHIANGTLHTKLKNVCNVPYDP